MRSSLLCGLNGVYLCFGAYFLTLISMNQAKFFAKIAKLMQRYPDRSQSQVEDPLFIVKLFDIA